MDNSYLIDYSNLKIVRSTEIEMKKLCNEPKNTSDFFYNNIKINNAEFWAIKLNENIIGEIYIFKHLDDLELANGKDRAYLCAFRIKETYRGNGLGTRLVERVFERLKELDFTEVTIGVEASEKRNIKLYNRLGFNDIIKKNNIDPCDIDENIQPRTINEQIIFYKKTI